MAVVTIDRPAHGIEADAVLADNAGGIDQAIDHLVRQGHRRIAYLGDDERIFTARERVVAYRAAMARHIDVDETWSTCPSRPRRASASRCPPYWIGRSRPRRCCRQTT